MTEPINTPEEVNVKDLLDALPDRYLKVIKNSVFLACGWDKSAPNCDDCAPEGKKLLLYLMSREDI